jgi:hypothetical protein
VEQVPLPEQKAVGVNVVPLQEAGPQLTLVAAWVQAPAPLQAPVFPQVPFAAQRLCGSAVVLGTLVQVPGLPLTLQAWQVPQPSAAVVLQQTPSMQAPLLHSWLPRQTTPFVLTGRQLPFVPLQ